MALLVSTKEPEIKLEAESTREITFKVEIPQDSTAKLMEWSVVPAEKKEAYRSVTVQVTSGGITTRQYELPNAFIVDYDENFDNAEGTGEYTLVIKQMKNKLADVKVTGGFS